MRTSSLMVLMLALATAGVQAAEPVRVATTKDNSIVLVDSEWRDNAGRSSRIRIKGNQHLVAMMFDRSALEGRIVQSAPPSPTPSPSTAGSWNSRRPTRRPATASRNWGKHRPGQRPGSQ